MLILDCYKKSELYEKILLALHFYLLFFIGKKREREREREREEEERGREKERDK